MIDFGPPMDITPVSSPPHYHEYFDRGRTPLSNTEFLPASTHMISSPPSIGEFTISTTPIQSELLREKQTLNSIQDEQFVVPTLDEEREFRITLLVQKHDGAATSEDCARLDILTQRLRRLSPRSNVDELEVLTAMVEQVEKVSKDLDQLRTEYK